MNKIMKAIVKQTLNLSVIALVAVFGLTGCKTTTTVSKAASPISYNACLNKCFNKFSSAVDAGRSSERNSAIKNDSYQKCNQSCSAKVKTKAVVSSAASAGYEASQASQ